MLIKFKEYYFSFSDIKKLECLFDNFFSLIIVFNLFW